MSVDESKLARSIAIDAWSEHGEFRVGVSVGGTRVDATERLLRAATKVIHRAPLDDEERLLLRKAGVLELVEPVVPEQPQLAAGVRMSVELGAVVDTTLDGNQLVQPSELEYALFLTPFQARHIERLRALVLGWWGTAMGAAPSDEALAEALVGWMHALHTRELELQTVFDLRGQGLETRLVPLVELGQREPAFAPVAVKLEVPGQPPRHQRVHSWDGLRTWASALPAVVAGEATVLPEGLRSPGFLVEATDPVELADGDVLDLGFGSFLVGVGAERVLVDPWHNRSVSVGSLGRPAAIVLSHARLSSCPTEMLLLLPKDVPILLPRPAHTSIPNRMADLLRTFGFERVQEVVPGDRHDLWGGRIEVEAGSTSVQWTIQSTARTQRFLPGPPVPGSRRVDRVFADLRVDPRPGLFREPGRLLDPVHTWLDRSPAYDWVALGAQVKRSTGDDLILYDSGGRYQAVTAARFHIDQPAAFRRFGPYAHWDERPQRVRVTVSRPGERYA